MPTEIDRIWVCEDCQSVIGSGDRSGLDYWYSPEEAENRAREIDAGIEAFAPAYLFMSDGYDEFSRSPCECCGSTEAGTRHEAIVFGEDAE